jgi:hypothetical protein
MWLVGGVIDMGAHATWRWGWGCAWRDAIAISVQCPLAGVEKMFYLTLLCFWCSRDLSSEPNKNELAYVNPAVQEPFCICTHKYYYYVHVITSNRYLHNNTLLGTVDSGRKTERERECVYGYEVRPVLASPTKSKKPSELDLPIQRPPHSHAYRRACRCTTGRVTFSPNLFDLNRNPIDSH